jgi:hypothetical protein
MISILDSRGLVEGILEVFLHNISHILVPPAFMSTYRDFFHHILLEFPQSLTKSITRLDERGIDDVISARRQ